MSVALPFSKRLTACVTVFPCIQIAAPSGAQTLTTNAATVASLQAVYYALYANYQTLIEQDTVNQEGVLDAAIASAVTNIQTLNTVVQSLTVTTANLSVLVPWQEITANAVTQIINVQNAPDDDS